MHAVDWSGGGAGLFAGSILVFVGSVAGLIQIFKKGGGFVSPLFLRVWLVSANLHFLDRIGFCLGPVLVFWVVLGGLENRAFKAFL